MVFRSLAKYLSPWRIIIPTCCFFCVLPPGNHSHHPLADFYSILINRRNVFENNMLNPFNNMTQNLNNKFDILSSVVHINLPFMNNIEIPSSRSYSPLFLFPCKKEKKNPVGRKCHARNHVDDL